MVSLSTKKIHLKSSHQELFEFLSQPHNIGEIISFKKTRHLEVKGNLITFIIKWIARFNFEVSQANEQHILIESTKDVHFATAMRFDLHPEEEGSSVEIHLETDTTTVMDFTVQDKLQRWITEIAANFEKKFT